MFGNNKKRDCTRKSTWNTTVKYVGGSVTFSGCWFRSPCEIALCYLLEFFMENPGCLSQEIQLLAISADPSTARHLVLLFSPVEVSRNINCKSTDNLETSILLEKKWSTFCTKKQTNPTLKMSLYVWAQYNISYFICYSFYVVISAQFQKGWQ